MLSISSGFSSVKLSAALVQQAREAAQPLRRSIAGQVEYWATLGRIVEHSGLTAQEARAAIEGYEAAGKKPREKAPDTLQALKMRVLASSNNGVLQAQIRSVVEENREQAVPRAAA
jgi:ParD-like antitoxin of type II bacterial toxin-antitoxin system